MANHSASKKSIRQIAKRTLVSKQRSSKIKTYIKKVLQEVNKGVKEDAMLALRTAQSEIMKGISKNILKLNTASRKISQLSRKVKHME